MFLDRKKITDKSSYFSWDEADQIKQWGVSIHFFVLFNWCFVVIWPLSIDLSIWSLGHDNGIHQKVINFWHQGKKFDGIKTSDFL